MCKHSSLPLFLLVLIAPTKGSYQSHLRGDTPSNIELTLKNDTQEIEGVSEILLANSTEKYINDLIPRSNNGRITDKRHRATRGIIVKAINNDETLIAGTSTDACNIFQKRKWKNKITPGSYDFIRMGLVNFGERFRGLVLHRPKGVIGLSDHLSGTPKAPLTLVSNFNDRENLYVERFCKNDSSNKCGFEVKGRGPSGFKGPGSISIFFRKNMKTVQLSFRASGASKATALFFRRDGTYIDKLEVDISETEDYSFTHDDGKIRGIAIFPVGDALNWHKFSLVGLCYQVAHSGIWF